MLLLCVIDFINGDSSSFKETSLFWIWKLVKTIGGMYSLMPRLSGLNATKPLTPPKYIFPL
ncbi:hypothetical protein SDC9_120841 [bioreactor metagenome]|uniref:Uncharacterized protein n=1 Tax=bioreactor metagenome TaxID=1076179 RepID=A0A645CAA2_9ZZZZ